MFNVFSGDKPHMFSCWYQKFQHENAAAWDKEREESCHSIFARSQTIIPMCKRVWFSDQQFLSHGAGSYFVINLDLEFPTP